ncbi:MAG: MazG nucleotide pyrophosphohydrolase domain-containing protein [Bacteroidia bacterium]
MPAFPEHTDLAALQRYQAAVCQERGWDQTSVAETFLLLTEEVGELAKAIRKETRLYEEAGKGPSDLAGEFADVLSYLLELANRFDIDLATAYRDKEALNAGRTWH